jgi:hypothetical protein
MAARARHYYDSRQTILTRTAVPYSALVSVEGETTLERFKSLAIIALLALAAPVLGQDKGVELAWKFEKGKTFYQTMKTKTSQTMNIMNQPVKQEQDQEFVFSWNVKDKTDTAVVLEQKIESVKMSIKIGTNTVEFDSNKKDAADNPLSSFFKPLVGSAFTLTLDPKTMKVTKVEGREEFVKKVTEANPQMAALLRVILSEDQLKQMAEPAFAVVQGTGQKVEPNASWTRESKLSMGPIGSYDTKYTYTYKGPEERTIDNKKMALQKIEMKTDLTYKAPDPKEATGLPFKIDSGNLKTTEAAGTIYFDAEKGRVAESTMTVKLEGKLQISVAEQKADVDLKQEQTTTTTTSDTNPNAAAKTTS